MGFGKILKMIVTDNNAKQKTLGDINTPMLPTLLSSQQNC